MEKEYRELFDGVHASERLREEVMNMTENTKTRRSVPAAALIAAALVAALAGTALAAGLGRVHIDLTDPNETNTVGTGYSGYVEYKALPVECLSEEALNRAGKMEEPFAQWEFSSWADAEAFLGLELENNPKLAQLPQVTRSGTGCTVTIIGQPATETGPGVPVYMSINAAYQAEGCRIRENATLTIQHPDGAVCPAGINFGPQSGETHLENYITANGIEASIVARDAPLRVAGTNSSLDRTFYHAYFVRDSAAFTLSITIHDPYDHPDSAHALSVLKELLDAYE